MVCSLPIQSTTDIANGNIPKAVPVKPMARSLAFGAVESMNASVSSRSALRRDRYRFDNGALEGPQLGSVDITWPTTEFPVKPPYLPKTTQNLDSKRDKKSQKLA